MDKETTTSVTIDRKTFARLDRLAKSNNVSKKEFLSCALEYFEKYGINPVEHESPAKEMQKLIKRCDQVIAFIRKQEQDFLRPACGKSGGNSPAGGTCGTHQKGEMGQTQSRASIPAGAGEVEKSTGGENAGHRAAYSQKEAAGGRSGTPEEAKKEQRFRNGHVIFLFSGTKVTPHAAFVKGRLITPATMHNTIRAYPTTP